MIFEINKSYSNKTIFKNSKNVSYEGECSGGEHTIITETNKFVMLVVGAWRGTQCLYYRCVE